MNKAAIEAWLKLTPENKRNIFSETAARMTLPVAAAVEKDWWVMRTLEIVFQTDIAAHTVFKGGTSLSKAWKLIDRLSEDIDLALDRKFLGFDKVMNGSQIKKLRRAAFTYTTANYLPHLQSQFAEAGFKDVTLQVTEVKSIEDDPVKIEVLYPAFTEKSDYLPPRVLIEIGCRSLIEPFTITSFSSFVGEHFKGNDFADKEIPVPTVNPERTFLEKIFLLHEEFQQIPEKVRVERKSRHLYDLEKLMDKKFATKAMADAQLYNHIVEHRKTITPLRGIDYSNHIPANIDLLPPAEQLSAWKTDYDLMRESMFYRDSLSFEELIARIAELQSRINKINHG